MAPIQFTFALRTSSSVKTIHLLGSWDHYAGQLPLSKDKTSSKPGSWKGTFRFQGSTLQPGRRYWYYYIIDGYHVSHDPARPSTTEPTTRRILNILDVPEVERQSTSKSRPQWRSPHHTSRGKSSTSAGRDPRRDSIQLTVEIPKGRPVPISEIKAPKPITPYATSHILEADYSAPTVEQLTRRFQAATLDPAEDAYSPSNSPPSSVGSSLSSRSDSDYPSSASSLSNSRSALSGSDCSCERYGITRGGGRVRLDCGGSRCGFSDDSSSCCSSEDEFVSKRTRGHGLVIRR